MTVIPIVLLCCTGFILGLVVWNMAAWPEPALEGAARPRAVSVLIPARNEELRLPDCLDSVLRQGDEVVEVLVYNDHSADNTGGVIASFAEWDFRVRALDAVPLPPEWGGKNFACHRLALEASGDWLLYLDADARLAPGAVNSMVGEAERRDVTFLSCWPGLILASVWEKACMPLLNFSVFTLFPAPLSLVDQRPALGLAHGACLLMERATYFDVGGHEAVKREIFEDTCLARHWRAQGERGACLDGQDLVQVRMYESFREIWRGFLKNFFPAFRHEYNFWLFLIYHMTFFLLPFLAVPVAAMWGAAWWPWAAIALLVVAMRTAMSLRFGYPLWTVLAHPVAQALLIVLGVHSRWRCLTGAGVEWKSRTYHAAVEDVQP